MTRYATGVFYHPSFSRRSYLTVGTRLADFPMALDGILRDERVRLYEPGPVSRELVLKVHTPGLIEGVKGDPLCSTAWHSAGGVVMAGEKIATGEIGNAFAFIGAGGHHSGRDFFGGYCCFNDVALCVVNLREKHGFRPVGFWTTVIGASNQDLTYLLEWKDLAERERVWAGFMSDPDWLKAPIAAGESVRDVRQLLRGLNLNTVCEEARCPNLGECWDQRTATVMILGDVCTRACGFCNSPTGLPSRPPSRRQAIHCSAIMIRSFVCDSSAVFTRTLSRIRSRMSCSWIISPSPPWPGRRWRRRQAGARAQHRRRKARWRQAPG